MVGETGSAAVLNAELSVVSRVISSTVLLGYLCKTLVVSFNEAGGISSVLKKKLALLGRNT